MYIHGIYEGHFKFKSRLLNVWRRKRELLMSRDQQMERLAKKLQNHELEFLEPDSQFITACLQCGECCRNREDILLTPFDIYHMVKATGKKSEDIIQKYGDCYIGDGSHMPLVRLQYRREPDGSTTCYFLGRKEDKFYCRIHEHKPGVCRTFPLGKVLTLTTQDKKEVLDYSPKYFQQEYSETNPCPGMRLAMRENIKQTVVDWVGGAEKKRLSDRYSTIFNRFLAEYGKAIDYANTMKKWDELTQNMFFQIIGQKIYQDYNYDVDDDAFLDQMEENLAFVLAFTKELVAHPSMIRKAFRKMKEELAVNLQKINETA